MEKIESGNYVLYFYSKACGPCRVVSPIISQLADKYPMIPIKKIDAISDIDYARSLDITGVPTIIFYKDGIECERYRGIQGKQHIEARILSLLK